MPEYACGKCGWRATAVHIEGMLAASAHHEKTGCFAPPNDKEKS